MREKGEEKEEEDLKETWLRKNKKIDEKEVIRLVMWVSRMRYNDTDRKY